MVFQDTQQQNSIMLLVYSAESYFSAIGRK